MSVQKWSHPLFVSRELAVEYGLVKATREEQARRDAEVAAFRAKCDAAQPALREAVRALDAIEDRPARLILDLHQRVPRTFSWQCEGCEASGYEWDYPEWPCATTRAIAQHYGIDLTEVYLLERPEDGSLDAPRRDS